MKHCWTQYALWAVITVLGSLAMLSGCGQKGDLYLPTDASLEKPPAGSEPDPAPEPAQVPEDNGQN